MKIKIDTQERLKIPSVKKYIDLMLSKNKLKFVKGYTVEKLESGDYVTPDGYIGVERKYEDLIESVYSKRLKKQLKELRENFKHPFLFIEYDSIDQICESFNVSQKQIIGLIASCNVKSNVPVVFCGKYFAPTLIKFVEKAYEGKEKRFQKEYIPTRRRTTKKEFKIHMVASVPGVDLELAKRLLNHFDNSVPRIMEASVEELMEVEGIGQKKSEKIKEVFS